MNTAYTYDSLSRLLSVLHQAGTVTLDGDSYTYDNAGNRLTKTNALNSITENYSYDPIYQLTQVTQGLATTESYTYDAVGNRLSSLGMSPYAYNSSNELTSTPEATFTYDANGNTLTKVDSSGTTTYGWDFENRLGSVALPGGAGTVTFKYDPFGRRIQKSSSAGTTNYLYDGSNSVEEVDQTGAELAHYSQGAGIDEPLAAVRGGAIGFYEQDGLGSVTSLTDSTGAALNSYTYDAFGNVVASTGSFVNSYQFTGRDYDPETGLRYYRARYYDQSQGRFLSEDPARFLGGLNLYRYARNNPVLFQNYSGLAPAVLVPSNIVPGSKLEGDLDPLCRAGRNKAADAAMLNESIDTRFAEIEYYLNQTEPYLQALAADPGHLQRIENEFEALERCSDCDDEKPDPDKHVTDPNWQKVKPQVTDPLIPFGLRMIWSWVDEFVGEF